jgi:uncharacterized protein (DUF433 family)
VVVAATPTLGTGIYTLGEASYLLAVDERTLMRWSHASAGGQPALVEPSHGWAYSFHDLVSLAVVAVLRQRGVTPAGVRKTVAYLQDQFDDPRPLARRELVEGLDTAGRSVLLDDVDITKGGQRTMLATVEVYVRPIMYGRNRLARLWRPMKQIELNPEIQAGRPCIAGTRVTTDVVADRHAQGETTTEIAEDLLLTPQQVKAAMRWEQRLEGGDGLALVA